jgi:hypothetical protein
MAKSDEAAVGRKDSSGTEAVIKIETLNTRLPELVRAVLARMEVTEDLNAAIKATAEACGLDASTVKRIAVAVAKDTFEESKGKANQLSLAFNEVTVNEVTVP